MRTGEIKRLLKRKCLNSIEERIMQKYFPEDV